MSDEEDYGALDDEDDNLKSKKPRNSFIDDIAEESDDDDQGDEDEGEDDREQDGFLAPEDELINEEPYQPRMRNVNFPGSQGSTMEDIESSVEYYKKRYGNSYNYKNNSFQGGEFDQDVAPAALQPTSNDPKLWLVKCKIGSEKSVVLSLMRKAAEYANSDDPLEIYSVVSRESLKGFIYIEAVKRAHVEKAIANMTSIYGSKIQLIPTNEMVDVLTVRRDQQKKIGTWVRLKRGVYNGDLAQVIEHDENKGTVVLKVIPRLEDPNQNASGDKRKRVSRPTQRRLTSSMLQKYNAESHSDYYIINNNKYKDGYLILEQKIKLLQIDDVNPTLDEALKFQAKYDDSRDEGEASKAEIDSIVQSINETKAQESKINFQMGDMVEVREGSLKNLVGVIKGIQGDIVTILPKHSELTAPINLSTREIRKHFSAGDHIKVIAGKFEGETGSIVLVENGVATIFSDLSKQEIKAFTRDITISNEVASGMNDYSSGYELRDLVMIDSQMVGVIVRIDREVIRVLDQNNNVRNMRKQELGSKRNNKSARTLDFKKNTIMAGDTIKIFDGPNKGKTGTIIHIFRKTAFVLCQDVSDNSGIIATQATNLIAVTKRPAAPADNRMDNRNRDQRDNRGPRGDNRDNRQNEQRGGGGNLVISKPAQILSGTYKGWIGTIRSITGRMVELDVHSHPRPISLSRDQVRAVDGSNDFKSPRDFGSRTPRDYGSRTPSYVGGKTPLYGQTPSHELNRTWDSGTRNPVWATGDTPTSYPATPGFHATPSTPAADTPYENPKTPGISDFDAHTPYSTSEPVMTPFGNVGTPHTPAIPNTPGIHEYDDDDRHGPQNTWVRPGLEVVDVSGRSLFKKGKVTTVTGDSCTVQYDGNNEITVKVDSVDVSTPARNNKIMVIKGERKGVVGELCSLLIDGQDCMIRVGGEVIMGGPLTNLCKLAD